jgi:DNA repair protein RadA/Sms
MSKDGKAVYVCQSCGYTAPKWLGCCSGCGGWHTMVEESSEVSPSAGRGAFLSSGPAPMPLSEVSNRTERARLRMGMDEIDRVLGGGLVQGSLALLAGEPGIGKSTLLLQALNLVAGGGKKVLYVSGEESPNQIRMRAERIGEIAAGLWVVSAADMEGIEKDVQELNPSVLAIDSVQTLFCRELASAPGSIAQVREVTARLVRLAKTRDMPTIMVGHVTKEGAIAGPRVLEHLVDTVLYFEGDRSHTFRLLRTVKNRFGPTHEIGVFEMSGSGLRQVANPSELFLSQRPKAVPGSVVLPYVEGTRPILVELQTLVSPSHLAMPRRASTGVDGNRLGLLIAVAERHLGVALYDRDIFVNVVGGLRIQEPAVDLALIAAMISSLREVPIALNTAVFGEVGLTGEVRAVGRTELRLNEAARLGLRRCVVPRAGIERLKMPADLDVVPVGRMEEAVEAVIGHGIS